MSNYFNQLKNKIENFEIKEETDCIRTVCLNVTDLCNKSCSYCPHSNGFENNHVNMMSVSTAEVIAKRLKELNRPPRLTISGMGEPFLNPKLDEIAYVLKEFNPVIMTNGTIERNKKWFENELKDKIKFVVSIHDMFEYPKLKMNFPDAVFRNHDKRNKDNELIETNRAGWFSRNNDNMGICTCPFYKIMIDYDGSYLLCADDWGRNSKMKNVDIFHLSLKEYFTEYLEYIKTKMLKKGRQSIFPCNQCDINGGLIGENILEWYKKCFQLHFQL